MFIIYWMYCICSLRVNTQSVEYVTLLSSAIAGFSCQFWSILSMMLLVVWIGVCWVEVDWPVLIWHGLVCVGSSWLVCVTWYLFGWHELLCVESVLVRVGGFVCVGSRLVCAGWIGMLDSNGMMYFGLGWLVCVLSWGRLSCAGLTWIGVCWLRWTSVCWITLSGVFYISMKWCLLGWHELLCVGSVLVRLW